MTFKTDHSLPLTIIPLLLPSFFHSLFSFSSLILYPPPLVFSPSGLCLGWIYVLLHFILSSCTPVHHFCICFDSALSSLIKFTLVFLYLAIHLTFLNTESDVDRSCDRSCFLDELYSLLLRSFDRLMEESAETYSHFL